MTDPDPPTAADAVRELVHRFQAGDQEGARAMYAPGFRIQQPASFPRGGWHHDVVELFTVVDGLIAGIRVFQQDTHLLLRTLEPPH